MANDLFNLFGDKLKTKNGLVASDPQTLETLSESEEEQDLIIDSIQDLESVELKIDYSDFSNFVFFNSALDYFNITGEKILNDYPIDGTADSVKKFEQDLDGYQRYVLSQWPSNIGHLRFDTSISSSYIIVEDVGQDTEGGAYRAGILSPGTGSLSLEVWLNAATPITGTESVQIIAQKMSGSDGYTLYLTGSEVRFSVISGSVTDEVSAIMEFGTDKYIAVSFDRSSFTGSLTMMTGSSTEFPVAVQSSSIGIFGSIDIGEGQLSIASGSISGKTTDYFTGSMDDVRIWKKTKTLNNLSSSFNVKQHAESGLVALYRFNGSGSADLSNNRIVTDYSGKKLDGRIQNYYPALRGSGSLLISEYPDPVLNVDAGGVQDYIMEQQISGSTHDRSNGNKLTDMMPERFFTFQEEIDTDILRNFLYIYARNFDDIKQHIDQFVNILTVNYGEFDQAPDALLDVVAQFFGWEFTGNFLNTDAFQYILGKNVLSGTDSNSEIDTKLYDIKNQFWKRTLLNLVPMYKSKGTKESVKILLRSYGVNENFVRIKEYGNTPNVGIETKRIKSEKSVYALGFGSGSLTGSVMASFSPTLTGSFTLEGSFKFPLTSSSDIMATELSGTMMVLDIANSSGSVVLSYEKDSIASHTGTLILSSSDGTNYLTLPDAGIFNNEWHHISIVNNIGSSSLGINVRHLDEDNIDTRLTASLLGVTNGVIYENITGFFLGPDVGTSTTTSQMTTIESGDGFGLGGFGGLDEPFGSIEASLESVTTTSDNTILAAEYWAQEVRYWDKAISSAELDDHTMNFQSYGVCDTNESLDNLRMHLRLREGVTASLGGVIEVEDVATNSATLTALTASGWAGSPYKKFLNDYNYIASLDFGWNDDKIRIFDSTDIKQSDFVDDAKIISLEFNMVDALNEDIVQTMKSLDALNEAIGYPSNKYRVNYDDLEVLRHNYFKRLQGRLNFTVFADMLEFFDRSFIDLVKQLIPGRAFFMGDEFVVESHMLERPKITYERRKFQETELSLEGIIEMWSRFRD